MADSSFKNIPPSTGSGGGAVSSVNSGTGDITIASGTNVSVNTVGSVITISSTGGTGDVVGPSSSSASGIPVFSGTTGKLLADSGVSLSGTNPALMTPETNIPLRITGYANSTGTGGSLTLRGGDSTTTSTGGSLVLRGGDSTVGPTTVGGNISINGGSGNTTNLGASVTITGGLNTATGAGTGGTTTVSGGGSSGTGAAGTVVIRGGRNISSGAGGPVQLRYGNSAGGVIGVQLDASGNIFLGTSGVLSTSAINGFVSIPSMAGSPSGVPTLTTGLVPLNYNSTDQQLSVYSGGSWNIIQNIISESVVGNSGAAVNISFSNSPAQFVTLDTNTTITLSGLKSGGAYSLRVVQDGTGGHTATIASAKWPGGMAPIFSTGIGAVDIVYISYDGTNIYASIAQNFS